MNSIYDGSSSNRGERTTVHHVRTAGALRGRGTSRYAFLVHFEVVFVGKEVVEQGRAPEKRGSAKIKVVEYVLCYSQEYDHKRTLESNK